MERINCVVNEIAYQNPQNGYAVLKAKEERKTLLFKMVGYFFNVNVGIYMEVEGEWKCDKKYGMQFEVQSWKETLPATLLGIERYLSKGQIKGIGPKMAHEIVARFGTDTFDIIDNHAERLLEVPGIGSERAEKIKANWDRNKEVRDIMVFLQGYGVSTSFASKIYEKYKSESINKVKDNPYCLADDILGIGFKGADRIAQNMGYTLNDPRRCRSGVLYTLNKLAEEGHVFAEQEQLLNKAKELLAADGTPIVSSIDKMIKKRELILEEGAIFLPSYYYAECGTASMLKNLMASSSQNLFYEEVDIDRIINGIAVSYNNKQHFAIELALQEKVMVLTGGPGTGKTTTTKGIIAALESVGLEVVLAAPTGRAAKRLSEATKREAKTIHRLLEYNPEEGFKRNADNPLEGDVLIVDECSMVDISLMYALLYAIPRYMRLILVGDIDQLPSVGAGNVLHDIIESKRVPVICLTEIFRQAGSSRIITNAHRINKGCFPDIHVDRHSDFFFIKMENAEQKNNQDNGSDNTTNGGMDVQDLIAKEIVNLVKERIPKAYRFGTYDIQVLTPMRRGTLGVTNLNLALQNALNPDEDGLSHGEYTFRKGDKVMQIRNNYDKNVFNGDVGVIYKINKEEQSLQVLYDGNLVEYEDLELDELVLAYATTIHKSQGSEYAVVVMPVSMAHYMMLQRNLIYTGITRAKKLCIMIGSTKALAYAIHNQVIHKRNTRLKERLRR